MHALTSPRWRLPILLLVAIVARALTFGNPVVHVDEEFYFTVASRMWHGALPYIDVWDRKPIGLFLLYMPAAALPLPWGTWAYQAIALGCVVGTAMLVARLADRAGWDKGATMAGIASILWLDPLGGAGGQSPIFYNLPMAVAGLLVGTATGPARRARGLAPMALVGLCLQIKYTVVFEGIFFGLWLLAGEWQARRAPTAVLGYAAALIGLALLPTVAALATYAAMGQNEAFVYANFTSILARRPDSWGEALGNAAGLALMLSPLLAMAFGSRGTAVEGDALLRRFLFAWFAVSLAAIALFGGWYEHYGLPAVVPGAACAAGFLGSGSWHGRATPIILALVGLVGQATVIANRFSRGSGAQLAALTAAVGNGPGCLYVYSGPAILYRTANRCILTPYLFSSHLSRTREQGAIGVDQAAEIRRIFAARPAVVVMRQAYPGERADVHALVSEAVGRDYRRSALLPMGDSEIGVYLRR